MENEKVYAMSLAKLYSCLVNKATRKGRTEEEVKEIIEWLMGYSTEEIDHLVQKDISYGEFFRNAPMMNPRRKLIKGSICGIKLDSIEEPLMQDIRYLDKLIDELAKGKSMEKIKR